MDRRKFLGTTAQLLGAALVVTAHTSRTRAKHELLVAEPVHSTGYLPMYIAMAKDYLRRVRHQREDRHHRDRRRPHQCGAVRPGLRLHRRPRAQRLRQGQGRRPARRGQLRRPRQCLFLRRQGPGPEGQGLGELLQGQVDRGQPLWRHAEFDHALPARQVEARRQGRTSRCWKCRTRRCPRPCKIGKAAIGVTHRADDHAGRQAGLLGRAVLSTSRRSSAPTPIRPSTSASIRSRRSRRWCAASSAA